MRAPQGTTHRPTDAAHAQTPSRNRRGVPPQEWRGGAGGGGPDGGDAGQGVGEERGGEGGGRPEHRHCQRRQQPSLAARSALTDQRLSRRQLLNGKCMCARTQRGSSLKWRVPRPRPVPGEVRREWTTAWWKMKGMANSPGPAAELATRTTLSNAGHSAVAGEGAGRMKGTVGCKGYDCPLASRPSAAAPRSKKSVSESSSKNESSSVYRLILA